MNNKLISCFIVVILIIYSYNNIIFYEKYTNPDIKITPDTDNIKNKIIFILWTGGTLTQNRIRGIKQIREKTKCNVTLINYKDNLKKFILKDYPLHKGYKYLSAIHKSDYLRCYMMHHYGGGYSDIKAAKQSWIPAFEKIEKDKNIWALGLKGPNGGIAYPEEYNKEQKDKLASYHDKLIAVQYMIYRPRTKLTSEWYKLLNKRMDYYYEELKKNPAKYTREAYDRPPSHWCGDETNPELLKLECPKSSTKYPISWNRLLGQINYPLQMKYIDHITNGIPAPEQNNYI